MRDLRRQEGAAQSTAVVGFAAAFAAFLAVVIAAGPSLGSLVVSGITGALPGGSGGGAAVAAGGPAGAADPGDVAGAGTGEVGTRAPSGATSGTASGAATTASGTITAQDPAAAPEGLGLPEAVEGVTADVDAALDQVPAQGTGGSADLPGAIGEALGTVPTLADLLAGVSTPSSGQAPAPTLEGLPTPSTLDVATIAAAQDVVNRAPVTTAMTSAEPQLASAIEQAAWTAVNDQPALAALLDAQPTLEAEPTVASLPTADPAVASTASSAGTVRDGGAPQDGQIDPALTAAVQDTLASGTTSLDAGAESAGALPVEVASATLPGSTDVGTMIGDLAPADLGDAEVRTLTADEAAQGTPTYSMLDDGTILEQYALPESSGSQEPVLIADAGGAVCDYGPCGGGLLPPASFDPLRPETWDSAEIGFTGKDVLTVTEATAGAPGAGPLGDGAAALGGPLEGPTVNPFDFTGGGTPPGSVAIDTPAAADAAAQDSPVSVSFPGDAQQILQRLADGETVHTELLDGEQVIVDEDGEPVTSARTGEPLAIQIADDNTVTIPELTVTGTIPGNDVQGKVGLTLDEAGLAQTTLDVASRPLGGGVTLNEEGGLSEVRLNSPALGVSGGYKPVFDPETGSISAGRVEVGAGIGEGEVQGFFEERPYVTRYGLEGSTPIGDDGVTVGGNVEVTDFRELPGNVPPGFDLNGALGATPGVSAGVNATVPIDSSTLELGVDVSEQGNVGGEVAATIPVGDPIGVGDLNLRPSVSHDATTGETVGKVELTNAPPPAPAPPAPEPVTLEPLAPVDTVVTPDTFTDAETFGTAPVDIAPAPVPEAIPAPVPEAPQLDLDTQAFTDLDLDGGAPLDLGVAEDVTFASTDFALDNVSDFDFSTSDFSLGGGFGF